MFHNNWKVHVVFFILFYLDFQFLNLLVSFGLTSTITLNYNNFCPTHDQVHAGESKFRIIDRDLPKLVVQYDIFVARELIKNHNDVKKIKRGYFAFISQFNTLYGPFVKNKFIMFYLSIVETLMFTYSFLFPRLHPYDKQISVQLYQQVRKW